MGTFGLCDYLNKKDIPAKILNLAVYGESATDEVLTHYLDVFRPTHIAIILHWQETAESFLSMGEKVRSIGDTKVKILGGGFTAGYFGKDLLEKCDFLDYVIKGDPEKPLELLLKNTGLSEIPNLIYRSPSGIRSNKSTYCIARSTLSRISFCDLSLLFDHKPYIDAIEQKLGFPLFIGRGCDFSCKYCGGSRRAFKLHSGRTKPEVRPIDAIISDLKRLKNFTRKIYICYENDRNYVKSLFEEMKKENSLVKTFHLNYGAWNLPDKELLNLYKDIFISVGEIKPVFELSPEIFDDKHRKKIRKGRLYYSNAELRENLNLVRNILGDTVNVSVFFSRYHDSMRTYADVKKEIKGIYRLVHSLFREGVINIKISYDHLSTDVSSSYWEDYIGNPRDFDTLISALRRLKAQEQYGFPVNNLCLFTPASITEQDVFRIELLIFLLKTIETYFHEMFHILFKCLDEKMVDLIEDIMIERFEKTQCNLFRNMDHCELVIALREKIIGNRSFLEKIPFIEDLTDLGIKKARYRHRPVVSGNSYKTNRPKLNREFLSFHDHDYLNLKDFLGRLDREGARDITPEKTVLIFLSDEIMSMNFETYTVTLGEFEKGISVDEYHELMTKKGIFNHSYHETLIGKLFRSGVLL